MKRLFCFFLIATLLCSNVAGCALKSAGSNQYHVKEELVEAYQMNDMAEQALFDFFEFSKESYRKYQKNNDMEEFINSVYDTFIDFHEGLDVTASIESRLGSDKEANMRLVTFSIDYAIAIEEMLELPLRYEETPYSVHAEDILLAVNNISEHFCGTELFKL